MTTADTSERGLEALVCTVLAGDPCEPRPAGAVRAPAAASGGVGWAAGSHHDYDRESCVDLFQLAGFLRDTQPETAEALDLSEDTPTRRRFLARLRNQVSKRGTVDVLRHGIRHGSHDVALFYGAPSAGNDRAAELFERNRFTVTRQLRYSRDETGRALDIGLFVNGLPIVTFELKNNLTKQTVADAVEQYRRDRDPREELFRPGRCVAHFAVDEGEVRFCTRLQGPKSWFLPFNLGSEDGGAGNPPNPDGLRTDYLWREVLARESLADLLENYAQMVDAEADGRNGGTGKTQIWPRYHQLELVRRLLTDLREHGAGKRYLVQHSAGSGKSNSIAWLAHQLISLERNGATVFDSIIVVTDRRVLDRQIHATIRRYAQVSATVGHAERSGNLRRFIEEGKKIVISTVQKFPFILDEIGDQQRGRSFAIIIDEAHSSQGGRTSTAMTRALSEAGEEDEDATFEDRINRLMESRKLLSNASYFAFTATPKNKTLEIFGEKDPQPDGTVKHRPFHRYTMKQAIQEGFILDVLAHYTPVNSYYKLAKTVEDDPEFDVSKARKKLRRFVEGHRHTIRRKAEIMVDHFDEQVLKRKKIGGDARAMVVTDGVDRAIRYYHAIRDCLAERKSPFKALVAFSGERKHGGATVSEASLNGFPPSGIAEKFRKDPYRFLICADKFQTGYDEPLLHTMYVDKTLSGIKAVQTLSRLNRAEPRKDSVFVLDFENDIETIRNAFAPYYRTTILADETDPDRLHDLRSDLDGARIYTGAQVQDFARRYLGEAGRERLDPILDACVAVYMNLDEDRQVDFKGKAKGFLRTYDFLSAVLPYVNADWEKLSIFLNFLVPKLPAPREEDLSRGILDAIDMDSYRLERQAVEKIVLAEGNGEIDPVPTDTGGQPPEQETDRLSNILDEFNDLFGGGISWNDTDRVGRLVTRTIPSRVAADTAFVNATRNSDEQNARIEHADVLRRVMTDVIDDDTELYRQFTENPDFQRWMTDAVFKLASAQVSAAPEST